MSRTTTTLPALPSLPSLAPVAARGRSLSPLDLLRLTRARADDVRAGRIGPVRYGDPDRPGDPEARWHVRLHADDDVDVWLISWLHSQGTSLHDHGGSAGAFTVVRGALAEAVWQPGLRETDGALVERRHATDSSVAFGASRVHDVRNLDPEPAVSVHAYSPPLTRMGYFAVDGGALQLTSVLATTDPEPSL